MQQFIESAEKECEGEGSELDAKHARQDCVKALKKLFQDFESQLRGEVDQATVSSNDSEEELPEELLDQQEHPVGCHLGVTDPAQELSELHEENLTPQEPQLYLCDDWIRPVEAKKPCELLPHEKFRARVAKNFLLVTLVSLNVGYGSLIENYQREEADPCPPVLNSIILTEEESKARREDIDQRLEDGLRCMPAGLPPPTVLARHLADVSANNSSVAVKDANLKMHHVMSVKQSLREDLAEHISAQL